MTENRLTHKNSDSPDLSLDKEMLQDALRRKL